LTLRQSHGHRIEESRCRFRRAGCGHLVTRLTPKQMRLST
jgi:hypothetical protein